MAAPCSIVNSVFWITMILAVALAAPPSKGSRKQFAGPSRPRNPDDPAMTPSNASTTPQAPDPSGQPTPTTSGLGTSDPSSGAHSQATPVSLRVRMPMVLAQETERVEIDRTLRRISTEYTARCLTLRASLPPNLSEQEYDERLDLLVACDPVTSLYLRMTRDDVAAMCPLWRTVDALQLPAIITAVTGPRRFSPPPVVTPPLHYGSLRALLTEQPAESVVEFLRNHYYDYYRQNYRGIVNDVPDELWRGDPFWTVMLSIAEWIREGTPITQQLVTERFHLTIEPSSHPVHICVIPTPPGSPIPGFVGYLGTPARLVVGVPRATPELAWASLWIRATDAMGENAPNRADIDSIIAATIPAEVDPAEFEVRHEASSSTVPPRVPTTMDPTCLAPAKTSGVAGEEPAEARSHTLDSVRTSEEPVPTDAHTPSLKRPPVSTAVATKTRVPPKQPRICVEPIAPLTPPMPQQGEKTPPPSDNPLARRATTALLTTTVTKATRTISASADVGPARTSTTPPEFRAHSTTELPDDWLDVDTDLAEPLDWDEDTQEAAADNIDLYGDLSTSPVNQDEPEPEPELDADSSTSTIRPRAASVASVASHATFTVEEARETSPADEDKGAFNVVEAVEDEEVFDEDQPGTSSSTVAHVLAPPHFPDPDEVKTICKGIHDYVNNDQLKALEEKVPNRTWRRMNLDLHLDRQCKAVWKRHGATFKALMIQWLGRPANRERPAGGPESLRETLRALAGQISHAYADDRTPTQVSQEWYTMYGRDWTPPIVRRQPALDHLPLLTAFIWMECARHNLRLDDTADDAWVRMVFEAQARRVCPMPNLAGTAETYDRLQTQNAEESRHVLYHAMLRRFGDTVDVQGRTTDDRYFIEGPSTPYAGGGRETLRIPFLSHILSPLETMFPLVADGETWACPLVRYAFLRFTYLSVLGPPTIRMIASLAAIASRHSSRMTISTLVCWWNVVHHQPRGPNDLAMDAGWWRDSQGMVSDRRPGFYALFSVFAHWFQENPGLFIRLVPRLPFHVTWTGSEYFGIPDRLFNQAMTQGLQEALRNPSLLVRGAIRLMGSFWSPGEEMDHPGEDPTQWPRILRSWVPALEAIHESKVEATAWAFNSKKAYSRTLTDDTVTYNTRTWIQMTERSPSLSPQDPDIPSTSGTNRDIRRLQEDEDGEDPTEGGALEDDQNPVEEAASEDRPHPREEETTDTSDEDTAPRRRRRPHTGKDPPLPGEPQQKRRRP